MQDQEQIEHPLPRTRDLFDIVTAGLCYLSLAGSVIFSFLLMTQGYH